MKGRRRIMWLVSLCLLVGSGIFVLARRSSEPTYKGKTSAFWFRELRNAMRTNLSHVELSEPTRLARIQSRQMLYVAFPQTRTGPYSETPPIGDPQILRSPAAVALVALGTNAALYLAHEIRHRDSRWDSWYRSKLVKLSPAARRILPDPPAPRTLVQNDAAFALLGLGSAAGEAGSVLIEGLKDPSPACRLNCIAVLRRLFFEPAEVDAVVQELARSGNRSQALEIATALALRTPTSARLLGESLDVPNRAARNAAAADLVHFGPGAKPTGPMLGVPLKDFGEDARYAAARALEAFGPDAVVAVPSLVNALGSEDDELRYLSARALSCIGTGAVAAVPALTQATNDSHEMVRRAAARALERISQ